MLFALTTRWNAGQHTDGEAMIEEILEMGFPQVELGYDLRMDLVPGVKKMVEQKAVTVNSLHSFCPLPIGAAKAHPELFTLSDPDSRVRNRAMEHTSRTIRFAGELGAKAVVTHAGNVKMKRIGQQLLYLWQQGKQLTPAYDKLKLKLQIVREKKSAKQLRYLYEAVELLLPVLEESKVTLCIENLPTWEAIPTEVELEALLKHFNSPHLGCWYDIGHGQVRENLGMINQERWLERLQPYLTGMHIHDVTPPAFDHLMPPNGEVDFQMLRKYAQSDVLKVIEPMPMTPREEIMGARDFLVRTWS